MNLKRANSIIISKNHISHQQINFPLADEKIDDLLASESIFEVYPVEAFSSIILTGSFCASFFARNFLARTKARASSRTAPIVLPDMLKARIIFEASFCLL